MFTNRSATLLRFSGWSIYSKHIAVHARMISGTVLDMEWGTRSEITAYVYHIEVFMIRRVHQSEDIHWCGSHPQMQARRRGNYVTSEPRECDSTSVLLSSSTGEEGLQNVVLDFNLRMYAYSGKTKAGVNPVQMLITPMKTNIAYFHCTKTIVCAFTETATNTGLPLDGLGGIYDWSPIGFLHRCSMALHSGAQLLTDALSLPASST